MTSREKWTQLLSSKRLGKPISAETKSSKGRTAFHRDFDRIVFSSAFRRLQDKTQVVPFARSDYVRTRLTHSIEASCVGRSLGLEIGMRLKNCLPEHIDPSDVGQIVAAACLAHDIGNAPFGHSGETAIQLYFAGEGQQYIKNLPSNQRKDFENFDGNAQGFRVLTRLQHPNNPGLQLTCATLAAFIKYPNPSVAAIDKKFSYFQSEKQLFEDLARNVGLIYKAPGAYQRHPLAFLVEAADDICYTIMDFEDAFRLGHLTIQEICDHLEAIGKYSIITNSKGLPDDEKVAVLRAKSIENIISEVAACFIENKNKILCGQFHHALIEQIKYADQIKKIKSISTKKYYASREILEIEVPAFDVLSGLLDDFIEAVEDIKKKQNPRSKKVLALLPRQFLDVDGKPEKDKYQRLLKITDFVSGMSDSYAVSLYKTMKGLSLPRT